MTMENNDERELLPVTPGLKEYEKTELPDGKTGILFGTFPEESEPQTTKELTETDVKLLSRFVSHIDRPVYSFSNLPPEFIAGLFARYSRSSDSIVDIFLDKLHELELTPEQIEHLYEGLGVLGKLKNSPTIAKLHNDFTLKGHDSIAKLSGSIPIAVDQCSMLAASYIRGTRAGNSVMERSTRFQRNFFTKPVFIKNLFTDNDLRMRYDALMRIAFSSAQMVYDALVIKLNEMYPHDDTQEFFKKFSISEPKWRQFIMRRAMDNARYFIPVSACTGLGIVGNSMGINRMTTRLYNCPSMEFVSLAKLIHSAAADVSPYLSQKPEWNMHDHRQEMANDADIRKMRGIIISSTKPESKHLLGQPRHLVDACRLSIDRPHMNNSDFLTMQGCLIIARELSLPVEWVYDYLVSKAFRSDPPKEFLTFADSPPGAPMVSSLDFILRVISKYEGSYNQNGILNGYRQLVSSHEGVRKYRKLGRTFEFVDLTFDVTLDFGAWRDINTHQLISQWVWPLVPNMGYSVPDDFDLLPETCKALFQSVYTMSVELWKEIYEKTNPFMAQYAGLFMWNQRRWLKMNVREFDYMLQTRSPWVGHHSYRRLMKLMYDQVIGLWPDSRHLFRIDDNEYIMGFCTKTRNPSADSKKEEIAKEGILEEVKEETKVDKNAN